MDIRTRPGYLASAVPNTSAADSFVAYSGRAVQDLTSILREIPDDVRGICKRLRASGHRAWVVGGCVRDVLLQRAASDWDLATSARPEQVRDLFERVIPTGIEHGTVTVLVGKRSYEVTTLRGDGTYSDGRRPDSVVFVEDIRADLARRDFTVNALAVDPLDGSLHDPFGGVEDLAAGLLRAVGDPVRRFSEDGLRLLRGARFVATLELELEPNTRRAMSECLETFRQVSHERIRDELNKALRAARPSRAFKIMRETGILGVIQPAFDELEEGAWRTACQALDSTRRLGGSVAVPSEIQCLGVLLGFITAPGAVDRPLLEAWFRDYRYSNSEREDALSLVFAPASPGHDAEPADLRRFARSVGRDHVLTVLALRRCLAEVRDGQDSDTARSVAALGQRIDKLLRAGAVLEVRDLAIKGGDLIRDHGMQPGPEIGRVLDALLERTLDDPSVNSLEHLGALVPEVCAVLAREDRE